MALETKGLAWIKEILSFFIEIYLYEAKILSTGGSNPFTDQSFKQRSQFLEAWVQPSDSTQLPQSNF